MESWEEGWERLLKQAQSYEDNKKETVNKNFDSRIYQDQPIRRKEVRTDKHIYGKKSPVPRNHEADRSDYDDPDLPEQMNQLMHMMHGARTYSVNMASKFSWDSIWDRRFYEQAKFMENYEDDYHSLDKNVHCILTDSGKTAPSCIITYDKFNTDQLRSYFTWRTSVRCGDFEEAPEEFLYLYVYELLNQIGVESAEDGYTKLKNFKEHCVPKDDILAKKLERWLFDYVIYYRLDPDLLKDSPLVQMDLALNILLESFGYRPGEEILPDKHNESDIFEAAALLSSYPVKDSGFAKKYPKMLCTVTCRILDRLTKYCKKNRKTGFLEGIFGIKGEYYYNVFSGATFYDRRSLEKNVSAKQQDDIYEVDVLRRYKYINNRLVCESFYNLCKSKTLGEIIEAAESMLRKFYQYEEPLEYTLETRYILQIIRREVRRYYTDEKKAEEQIKKKPEEKTEKLRPSDIHLDLGKLDAIRRAAWITQVRLTVEKEDTESDGNAEDTALDKDKESDENADNMPLHEEASSDSTQEVHAAPAWKNLTADEFFLLHSLVCKEAYMDYFLERHLLLSVTADAINEKLFDEFGDTVIDFESDEPVLIEDYREDIKKILAEE